MQHHIKVLEQIMLYTYHIHTHIYIRHRDIEKYIFIGIEVNRKINSSGKLDQRTCNVHTTGYENLLAISFNIRKIFRYSNYQCEKCFAFALVFAASMIPW